MAWFKLEETFPRHPKVRKLADRLGLSMIEARGHLATLWCWVCGYAPDGDLESFDEDDIELAAEWEGERGAFIEACRQVGLIDEHEDGYEIHEWMERAESFKKARQKREQREREKAKKEPTLYVVDDGPVFKVGYTLNLKRRTSEYVRGSARLATSKAGSKDDEAAIHRALAAFRVGHPNSEWYKKTQESLAILAIWFPHPSGVEGHGNDTETTLGPERRGEDREERTERTERTERSTPQTPQGGPTFDEAWALVPRKEGKKAARRHWRKLTKDHQPEDLIRAVERYTRHVQATKTDPQFVMQGSTLINNLEDWLQQCPRCRGRPCGQESLTPAQRVAAEVVEERMNEERHEAQRSQANHRPTPGQLPIDEPPF